MQGVVLLESVQQQTLALLASLRVHPACLYLKELVAGYTEPPKPAIEKRKVTRQGKARQGKAGHSVCIQGACASMCCNGGQTHWAMFAVK